MLSIYSNTMVLFVAEGCNIRPSRFLPIVRRARFQGEPDGSEEKGLPINGEKETALQHKHPA
jgi:hypothetical protein